MVLERLLVRLGFEGGHHGTFFTRFPFALIRLTAFSFHAQPSPGDGVTRRDCLISRLDSINDIENHYHQTMHPRLPAVKALLGVWLKNSAGSRTLGLRINSSDLSYAA
jgi:hypothetical protein